MALETVSVDLNQLTYTQIGNGVTSLLAQWRHPGPVRIHVVADGGSAPAYTAATYIEIEKGEDFSYDGTAADIYALAPTSTPGQDAIKVVRE